MPGLALKTTILKHGSTRSTVTRMPPFPPRPDAANPSAKLLE